MKKAREFTVKYTYDKPKTPEEKERQQRRLNAGYAIIFDKILKDELKTK